MRLIRLLFIAFLLTPHGVAAQVGQIPGWPPTIIPFYIGPGNIAPSAEAWVGLRAYSAAIAATGTQAAVDLRRPSDNAT